MSVVTGKTVTRFVPPYLVGDAVRGFEDDGVIEVAVVRRDYYDELVRMDKIARAFMLALDAAKAVSALSVLASNDHPPTEAKKP